MDVRYLILSLFFLVSCMPEATVSKGNLASTGSTGGTTSGTTGGTTSPTNLSWNYLGQLINSITINVSNLQNAYVVGTPVEVYLADSSRFINRDYCLISSYSVGGISYELRSRIVPISYYDFNQKRTVKNMRVDFQDVTNSSSICNKTVRVRNTTGDYVVDTSTPPSLRIKYNPRDICPSCTSMQTATRTRIFSAEFTTLDEVPLNYINTTALNLQIDPNESISGDAGICSTSACRAKGFDCCLDNQCVREKAERPAAASMYPTLLATAKEEMKQNPLAYLNYPQLFYICGSTVPTTGGSSGGTTGSTSGGSSGGYDEAFNKLKKDYQCIEHIKAQITTTPFHNDLKKDFFGTTDCLTKSSESAQTFYYQNVFKRLYSTCGCDRTSLDDMIQNCPNYDYTVSLKDPVTQEPLRIDCYTPPQDSGSVPPYQSVSVSGRSAPHRFFDKNGVERNPSDGIEQEGDLFAYMDQGKLLPVQQKFSMNAILGQMTVALDQALPAKEVKVEMDQVYLISTVSGYYTPCPECAKDSWLNSFSAFPSSSSGVGLQAIGHTTERDSFSTNTTAGNYEDTIFGRACWIPPTMIPYSHSGNTSPVVQRKTRLQTQAALYVNGYQRDWYGFNKGALIGSFDGVTWFAIGKGRIVRSTSKKLFLAINAPFADLAAPTMHSVSVAAYDGITQAAQVDYDPQYHQNHPYQNEAGNCQMYHMCSTDTDCVTKLGWEYACADVKDLKTNWPTFSSDGKEASEVPAKSIPLYQILQQKSLVGSSSKRCVYRGAGALCHTSSGTIASADLNKRKLLTCAPNFFCSNLSSGYHNQKIARYAANLEEIPVSNNHFFGKDANIAGRPHDYTASGSIDSTLAQIIRDNVAPFESTLLSNAGFCQPGKALPDATNQATYSNPFNQHSAPDVFRRTDFINQIGSCNSTLFTVNRHSSCPVIGSDGNYEMFQAATIASGYSDRATKQNACGLESLLTSTSLSNTADKIQESSPFRTMEAKPLHANIILNPTLVRDACFRRAGAVCHTDLDCSPNKMHAEQTELFGTTFFGNLAEKSYWSEYLVCGQSDSKPLPSNSEAFKNYDMSKNRCCREVGKDITTYTSDIPANTQSTLYDSASEGLKMSVAPGIAPNDPKRYSRMATVDGIGTSAKPILSAFQGRSGAAIGFSSQNVNVNTVNQWKTLTEANSESCCGGGWIRKFSDGSNDWTKRDRLILDVENFRCINSRSLLITSPEDLVSAYDTATDVASLVSQDYGDYCKDGTNTNGSCAQYSVLDSTFDVLPNANDPYSAAVVINTIMPDFKRATNGDNYFKPRSADSNPSVIIDLADSSSSARRYIAIRVPSFVTRKDFDDRIGGATPPVIRLVTNDGSGLAQCTYDNTYNPSSPTDGMPATACGGAGGCCYYNFDRATRILKVGMNTAAAATTYNNKKVGVTFTTRSAGNYLGLGRTSPGSTAYYLKRLGMLELSGVPQITYEALTCNDNSNKIVPGIFNPTIKYLANDGVSPGVTATNVFNSNTFSFSANYSAKDKDGNTVTAIGKRFTNQHGLAHEPVFSANDFKCCSPLGKTVGDASKCCSGFGVDIGTNGTQKICSLPSGTDLMVYFNRYISNEGTGTDQPGGGLTESDFNTQTGEPVLSATVNEKIRALGEAYCESGRVRQGGAFGSFEPEPQGNETNLTSRIYNLVDSARDFGTNANAGKTVQMGYRAFTEGFRWNHHLYCDYNSN